MVVLCAWCGKLKKSDDDPGEVSHGICADCAEKMLKDAGIRKVKPKWSGGAALRRVFSLARRQA
jgi:hypothetical protein